MEDDEETPMEKLSFLKPPTKAEWEDRLARARRRNDSFLIVVAEHALKQLDDRANCDHALWEWGGEQEQCLVCGVPGHVFAGEFYPDDDDDAHDVYDAHDVDDQQGEENDPA